MTCSSSMATQFVTLVQLQHPIIRKSFAIRERVGERSAANVLPQNELKAGNYQQTESSAKLECHTVQEHCNGDVKAGNYKKYKLQRRKHGLVARELLHRFGFCCLASSISCILKKAKAFFCHEYCCCDIASKDSRVLQGNEVMLIDPYFSFPVIPATSYHQHDW